MEAAIKQALHAIEVQEQVSILYACESGSRAWGFSSHDSDYGVHFLYAHPKAAYLRLDGPRDVIEWPIVDDLDVNGWDIFKSLRLLRKSNPPYSSGCSHLLSIWKTLHLLKACVQSRGVSTRPVFSIISIDT